MSVSGTSPANNSSMAGNSANDLLDDLLYMWWCVDQVHQDRRVIADTRG